MAGLLAVIQLQKAVQAQAAILNFIKGFDEVAPVKFDGRIEKLAKWIESTEMVRSLKLKLERQP